MKPKILALVICVLLSAAVADAKQYSAERFDSRVQILEDGSLRVSETVVFRFEEGTFTNVFREIPTRRTDGVEVLSAEMDGRSFPFGNQTGEAEIRRKERVRVTWRFPAVSGSSHTFTLTYLLRGAVRQEADSDRIVWVALPSQHSYRIESSTIQIDLPAPLAAEPRVELRRVGAANVATVESKVLIAAHTIRTNGWIEVSLRFPRGGVVSAPPAWQQRQMRQLETSGRWIVAAGMIVLAGLVLFFGMRQGYDPPPRDASVAAAGAGLPDDLPAPLAGVLVANGNPRLEHAMATLFILADRGEIRIAEQAPGTFGRRSFTIDRTPAGRPLSPSEEAALDTLFQQDRQVTLSKARSRLMRRFKKVASALKGEMNAAGLIDASRRHARDRFLAIGITLLLVGGFGFIAVALFVREFGPWPLLVPSAFCVAGVIGTIFAAAATPLSNEAIRRQRYWRAFRKHLKDIAQDRAAAPLDSGAKLLPFAVALGLASVWSKYLKRHPSDVPRWFHALSGPDASVAFVTLVAAGAASGHGGGAGGAAGGGGSGAG